MERVKIKETNLDFGSLSNRAVTDMIVLHHTGENDIDASAEQIHGWHLNQEWAGIGYHFVIRKDGTIERGRPEWAIGSHAYGENSHTIGIHLSGDFEQAKPTENQIESCAALIADLCERYSISCGREHIVGHGELMPTACPGKNLQALLDNGALIDKANNYLLGITNKDKP
ncbi:MAG: N-acetylmuramoyl-L-alanine amidase, partial [Selenomonadaceae bacterium]|nr:N-acetylmuramoyl-L-alanine amidase [Selenomonadaceae bacterium]